MTGITRSVRQDHFAKQQADAPQAVADLPAPACDAAGKTRQQDFMQSMNACPSCNTRRMVATAAHLTDHVLLALPVRQWVLSVAMVPFLFLQRYYIRVVATQAER